MIWKAVRNIFLAEFLAWIAFLLVGLALGALGAHSRSQYVSDLLIVLWIGLFLGAYKLLYRRL